MFSFQVNIGTDSNEIWTDVSLGDLVVFCDGYKGQSGLTGLARIANEFVEIKENYAKKSYLVRGSNVYEINWDPEKIMADDTANLRTLSFRYIYASDYIDQIKIPEMRCFIPRIFYGNTPINSSVNSFFQTDENDITIGNVLDLDNNFVEVTRIEQYSNAKKVFFRVLNNDFIIDKIRYICRNYGVYDNQSGIRTKILFHDYDVVGFPMPQENDDISDPVLRRHTTKNLQMDINGGSVFFPLDSSLDLTQFCLIQDATLLQNIEYSSTVVYVNTQRFIDFKRGDYIVFRNNLQSEIMQVDVINSANKLLGVNRMFSHKNFLQNDSSVKMFINFPIYFQIFVFNNILNQNIVNAPIIMYFDLKYLSL